MNFCPLCNIRKIQVKYTLKLDRSLKDTSYFKIIQCKVCKLVFSSLLDYPEQIDSGYEEEYFSKYDTSFEDNQKTRTFKKALKLLNKAKPKKGKILDFGCAEGNFLVLAKQTGWNVCGIDLSKFAAKIARKRGLNVFNKTINDAKFQKESFDVITLWDVIEHLSNLNDTFKEFKRVLKKDGLLVIRTPNEKSIFHLIAHLSYILSFKKIKFLLNTIYHSDHLYYFSKQTLTKILEKNGFKIRKIIMNDQTTMFYKNPVLKCLVWKIRFFGVLLNKQHAMLAIAIKK
ncbi:class I SAM-dependent methyltransferase [Candidatus Woesearchaeota archaeon]|nr:class I SAM-dependent methyltransferase [Candidatus Woesearchaeota archaeon]